MPLAFNYATETYPGPISSVFHVPQDADSKIQDKNCFDNLSDKCTVFWYIYVKASTNHIAYLVWHLFSVVPGSEVSSERFSLSSTKSKMAVTKCLVLISQLALLGVTVHAAPTVGVTCLDQNAKQVDWWYVTWPLFYCFIMLVFSEANKNRQTVVRCIKNDFDFRRVTYKLPTVNGNAQSNDGYGFAYTDAKTPFAVSKTLKKPRK